MHKHNKMKKIISLSALSLVILFSTEQAAAQAEAQDIAGGIFISPKSTRVVNPETKQSSRILAASEVNVSAARDFFRSYEHASNVTWVEGKTGISVYFQFNGLEMRSTYDKKGRKEYTLTYFTESTMPSALRHLVKSKYYDHTIDRVTQVERNNTVSHVVAMHNDKEILTVKVIDDAIVPFEKIQKINN